VNEGDYVSKASTIAIVSGKEVHPQTSGIITYVLNTPGSIVSPQVTLAKMIDPRETRLIGIVEEDKGLKDVKAGQKVMFTMDAYPGKDYEGFVDSIAPSSRDSDVCATIGKGKSVCSESICALCPTRRKSSSSKINSRSVSSDSKEMARNWRNTTKRIWSHKNFF